MDGDDVREIHVLTSSKRPAKQIVRDVQTLLLTRFNQPIDHRVVSVAYIEPSAEPKSTSTTAPRPKHATNGEALLSEAEVVSVAEPRAKTATGSDSESAAITGTETEDDADSESETETDDRIRFVSTNLYVSGPRVQVQVELKWQGVARMGSASGWGTREGAHRLVASATVAAIQEYLEEGLALSLEGLEFVKIGRQAVVVVALELLAHREHKMLVGSCSIGKDRQQAIVLATLSALNRVIGGLPTREPFDSN